MKLRVLITLLLLVGSWMWLTACTKDTGQEAPSGTVTPATPTAASLPSRVVEGGQEVVVTVTFEPGQEPLLSLILPMELLEEEKIAVTAHFDLYADDGYFPVPLSEWQGQVETIFNDVSAQIGTNTNQRIKLAFHSPIERTCQPRGMTIPAEPPQIIIFADDETSQAQLQGVLAHEVGHVLLEFGFDPPLSSNRALNEGLATWAAQPYWNVWQGWPSLAVAVQSFKEASTYLPLHENIELTDVNRAASRFGDECLKYRDILYTEWAAFQDYLIQQFGMEALISLFETAIPETEETEMGAEVILIKPPDYQAIYGQALNQLEAAWLKSLASSN
jgi:hypothetical protein